MNAYSTQDAPAAASFKGASVSLPSKAVESIRASDLPYKEFLRHFVSENRPVVVRDAVTRWAALSKWKPEYFKIRFGEQPVAVAYDKSMPFNQFIDEVLASKEGAPGPYMFRLFLHEHMPELLADVIPQNEYAYPRRYASPLMPERLRRPDGHLKLLIGGPGSKFPVMHYDGDNAHATITEIHGDKMMILYAPEDSAFVYPDPKVRNASRVEDPHAPDLSRFPLLAKATQYSAVLKPGETIFIPCRWWHTARPLTPSVSVCTNILDASNWRGFVDVSCEGGKQNSLKRLAKRWYFGALGNLLTACERLQYRAPALAHTLVLPEKLAPISAAIAPEPSARQLRIRIPTG